MLKDTTLQDSELLLLNDTLANICYYMLKDTKIKSVIWQQFLSFLIFSMQQKGETSTIVTKWYFLDPRVEGDLYNSSHFCSSFRWSVRPS